MCLRSDNVLVSIRTGDTWGDGWRCYDFKNTDGNYSKPPDEYIIDDVKSTMSGSGYYKLRNIKDIFQKQDLVQLIFLIMYYAGDIMLVIT